MIESLIKNLNQDIALLQLRIERDKDAGFNDMARLLESMSVQFFKAVGIANLESKNQIRVNFPAIDAADDHRDGGIAVQVTSVADAAKIKKTIAAFEKNDASGKSLKDDYAKLYIFGFCKASKSKEIPKYCQVIDPGFFVNRLVDLDDERSIQIIIDSIRRHIDYSSIHPYDDLRCLKIVLDYVGRNAVRHYMSCEGNIDDMTKGLNEISELIGKGTVNGKQKSKAQHEFEDQEIGKFLRHVLDQIGEIKAIINYSNRNGFVILDQQEMKAIDARKQSIAQSAEDIAAIRNIAIRLGMLEINKLL
ncbi:SMEK domain-containing protein [Xanthomonas cerealis]|uniref:SMEK domain-containing protein n=1 Tax=Xanthomonas cerealis TaxID=3390025 RepID=UPI00057995FA|nr:SMEK domain-containing protein [Xanthomonas translucens]UKE47057.1 SMEK domain-containing protein [Xanthomonas translucens pv. cerealis]